MSRRVQLSVVKAVVFLTLAAGFIGSPSAEAQSPPSCAPNASIAAAPAPAFLVPVAPSPASHYPAPCDMYAGCERCSCFEEHCTMGEINPECNGNANCCSSTWAWCWNGCYWY